MKTFTQIHESIKNIFQKLTNDTVERGSVVDLFMLANSKEMEEAYLYIESNKNPHIYTNLKGSNLDDMVKFCGFTRREGESDQNLLYRLINWYSSSGFIKLTLRGVSTFPSNTFSSVWSFA